MRAVRGMLDDLARRAHLLARLVRRAARPRRRSTATAQTSLERQVVARQRVRHGHAASLAPRLRNIRRMADPVFGVPAQELELLARRRRARARAPSPARLPAPLPRGLGQRARRLAALHRADVVRARDGRPARRDRRPARRQRPGARSSACTAASPPTAGPPLGDDRRRPRPRGVARPDRDRRPRRRTAALGARRRRRSCSRRRRATSIRPTARRPALVDRANVQQANALVQASAQALSIGGWALAAALARRSCRSRRSSRSTRCSFLVSAPLIARIRHGHERDPHGEAPRIREASLLSGRARCSPLGVIALGVAVTITAGTWIGGVPTLSATRSTTEPAASRS